ncbi:MAG: baseplate J/gp47 family protein [Proteobacteria bacterium]|nr:baseplate J/gp47 family protein [Pseudomonadota bacterium]
MPLQTPDLAAIQAGILRDVQNQLPEAATGVDSDFGVRAAAMGGAVEGLYQHQQWIARQTFPDTADTDMLEQHASLRGLTRKRATTARGRATFTGTPGATIPLGTEAKTLAGLVFITSEASAIGAGGIGAGGTAIVPVQGGAAGAAYNLAAGTGLTLTSAPSGVQGTASLATATIGGTDAETDAGLLARLLDLLRSPPAGGNKADWRRWAMDVDGVTAAYVFPLRRGIGTVDVCVTSGGGLPSEEILAAVRLHLDVERPTSVRNFAVFGPELLPVPVHALVRLSGLTLEQAQPLIEAALNAYFATLEPGDLVYLSRIETAISGVSGVVDRQVTAPATNVAITATQWARLGVVTLEVMTA